LCFDLFYWTDENNMSVFSSRYEFKISEKEYFSEKNISQKKKNLKYSGNKFSEKNNSQKN
jgi:hypothetical protein